MNDDLGIKQLHQRIDYQFRNPELLQLALSHRSCGANNNERLEFLGDSILSLVISDFLYQKFSDSREGDLSRMRSNLGRFLPIHQLVYFAQPAPLNSYRVTSIPI